MLLAVNGFNRATRGTFAQFGVPVPRPDALIDTVLAHAADERFFAPERQDACNVLDVAHPLWLAREAGRRRDEVEVLVRRLLDDALTRWRPGEGTAFGPGDEPGLQGTEMWLAIVWYLADLLGLSDALGYRPRGIHRPEARGSPAPAAAARISSVSAGSTPSGFSQRTAFPAASAARLSSRCEVCTVPM